MLFSIYRGTPGQIKPPPGPPPGLPPGLPYGPPPGKKPPGPPPGLPPYVLASMQPPVSPPQWSQDEEEGDKDVDMEDKDDEYAGDQG